jgi:antirestriction protein ArdC
MPFQKAFKTMTDYHATLLHEAVHATGHKSRLDRLTPSRFGSEGYAYEELVAELGAAMLCAQCGVDGQLQHSSYIDNWLRVLKSDKKFILQASAHAQKAIDWIEAQSKQELLAA